MPHVTWVLESEVFPESHAMLRKAILDAGHQIVDWEDTWWSEGFPPKVGGASTYFHGSLGNAARVAKELDWRPGSFCNIAAFCCSAWYEAAHEWLLHTEWRVLPACDLVELAPKMAAEMGWGDRIFVRPDSPLKPFSGRVLDVKQVTLSALDHGFYFEDDSLPVVAAPVRHVGREWRFVVVRSAIRAGSAYDASTHTAITTIPESEAWNFAQAIASELQPPADVYILDVCEADGELRLLELNPFGGADLYACNASSVVDAITEVSP